MRTLAYRYGVAQQKAVVMTNVKCPICLKDARIGPKMGDSVAIICPDHRTFKVAAPEWDKRGSFTQLQFENAFKKAKKRVQPGEWPVITGYDLA